MVVWKAARPWCLKDCLHELPIFYYNTQNVWFNANTFSDCLFNHFIPEVRKFQEKVLHIAPEDAKAVLLLDNGPAHPQADRLVSSDGCIRVVFLSLNATALIQPVDHGDIMVCKRFYKMRYLDEVLVVLEEEEDLIEDTRGLRTLNNVKSYNLKSEDYNFASAWKDVKITTLANCWKKLMLDQDPELDFEGFSPTVAISVVNESDSSRSSELEEEVVVST